MTRRTRNLSIAAAVLVAVVAVLGAAAWAAASWARDVEATARAGKTQLQAGARSLAAGQEREALAEFAEATRTFEQADALLAQRPVERIARALPVLERNYDAARTLVAVGIDGAAAASELAKASQEASQAAKTKSSAARFAASQSNLVAALEIMTRVARQAEELPEEGLVAPLARQVASLKALLNGWFPLADRGEALFTLGKDLISSEHRLLVVSQNSAELRPTGGFMGSYGILRVGPKGVKLEAYHDVYDLPNPPGIEEKPAGMRMTKDYQFRDANWWIDFPTSAQEMLRLWGKAEQAPVDGIVALDVVAMRDLLEVFGAVEVPEYDVTFTADNLFERLEYLVQVKYGGQPGRKDVLGALAEHLLERLTQADSAQLSKATLALMKAADEKHIQLYLLDEQEQSASAELGWSGSITPPESATDVLAVSNAMTRGSKANFAMSKSIDYAVDLRPDGSADTTLVLGYANSGKLVVPERGGFRDYLRVYRAPGTVLETPTALPTDKPMSIVENGLPTAVRRFSVWPGRTMQREVAGVVPEAWRPGPAAEASRAPAPAAASTSETRSDSEVAHYRLFVVRQADLQDVPTRVVVSAPAGWRVTGARAWLTASGEPLKTSTAAGRATLDAPLVGDTIFDVELERQ